MLRLHQNDRTNLFQNGKKHWIVKISLAASLGIALISAGSSFEAPAAHANSNAVDRGYSINVIRQVFGSDADQAIRVAECESGLNPEAYNPSGAAGLFQIMPGTWVRTSQGGASRYDAYANAVAAHEIFVRDGHSWREWACPA
jgi:soluble lytic murein transglycosylase-like protein